MTSTTLSSNYTFPLLVTLVSSASNNQTINNSTPNATINVLSTNGFPGSGTFIIVILNGSTFQLQYITYTGITSTTLTGCNGGNGTLLTNNFIQVISGDGSLAVASTNGFPTSGQLQINGNVYVGYTGISGNNFTGITGGVGSIPSGQTVQLWANGTVENVGISSPSETPLHNDLNNTQANTFGGIVANSNILPNPAFNAVTNYDVINPVNFKMRGFYVSGNTYETFIVQGMPSVIPPSGHTLINVIIEAIF